MLTKLPWNEFSLDGILYCQLYLTSALARPNVPVHESELETCIALNVQTKCCLIPRCCQVPVKSFASMPIVCRHCVLTSLCCGVQQSWLASQRRRPTRRVAALCGMKMACPLACLRKHALASTDRAQYGCVRNWLCLLPSGMLPNTHLLAISLLWCWGCLQHASKVQGQLLCCAVLCHATWRFAEPSCVIPCCAVHAARFGCQYCWYPQVYLRCRCIFALTQISPAFVTYIDWSLWLIDVQRACIQFGEEVPAGAHGPGQAWRA